MIFHDLRDVIRFARFAENKQGVRQGRCGIYASDDDHRNAAGQRVARKLRDDCEAAYIRQVQIEQDEIRPILLDGTQCAKAVCHTCAGDVL